MVLVHIEVPSSYHPCFHKRMFDYVRLVDRYNMDVLPIALFSYDKPDKIPPETISYGNFDSVEEPFLIFRYQSVLLNQLSWRKFIEMENPAATALVAKMGYTEEEKVELKTAFWRSVVHLPVKPEQRHYIVNFFDMYVKLDEMEELRMQKELQKLTPEEGIVISEMMNSYERRGWAKGREEGIEKGREELVKRMLSLQWSYRGFQRRRYVNGRKRLSKLIKLSIGLVARFVIEQTSHEKTPQVCSIYL